MARFIYNGEPPRPGIKYGPATMFRFKLSDGSVVEYSPVKPAKEFKPGKDIGHDIDNPDVLRRIRADKRFTEVKE